MLQAWGLLVASTGDGGSVGSIACVICVGFARNGIERCLDEFGQLDVAMKVDGSSASTITAAATRHRLRQ